MPTTVTLLYVLKRNQIMTVVIILFLSASPQKLTVALK